MLLTIIPASSVFLSRSLCAASFWELSGEGVAVVLYPKFIVRWARFVNRLLKGYPS